MAEELNMHFSSVFTREDTSSLPALETKFETSEGERLGQLVVCVYHLFDHWVHIIIKS